MKSMRWMWVVAGVATMLVWVLPAQAFEVGLTIDVHQDVPCQVGLNCPNDFHIEGLLCSPGSPPVLVSHIDDLFAPPNGTFTYSISPLGPDCLYWFKADWSLVPPTSMMGIPFCTIIHLGLVFDAEINLDGNLRNWWTRNGQRIGDIHQGLHNQGYTPAIGFKVSDQSPQKIRIGNGDWEPMPPQTPTPPEIPIEIVQMDVVAFGPFEPPSITDMRVGGGQESWPWVPVAKGTGGVISGSNPLPITADSFFDIFLEQIPGQIGPIQKVIIPSSGFLVARTLMRFTNNEGTVEQQWQWQYHQGAEQMPEACCFPNGDCQDLQPATCMEQGGTPKGEGTTCAETICLPLGVCCYGQAAPMCMVTDQLTCEQTLAGTWKGPGTDCSDLNGNGVADVCELTPPEACCAPDGSCFMEVPETCSQYYGGVPGGPGSTCLGDADGNGVDEACEGLTPLKWIQEPDINQTGIDVKSTKPLIVADDFRCTQRSAVTDITIWASWKDEVDPDYQRAGNVTITLSIHDDIPGQPYSKPGATKWVRTFGPGSFTHSVELWPTTEWWMDPTGQAYTPGDHVVWKYQFQIPVAEAFCQEGSEAAPKVYWLDVQAEPVGGGTTNVFGWKTSIHHWNDAATWASGNEPYNGPWSMLVYPVGHVWYGQNIDMAFSISGDQPCGPVGACCYPGMPPGPPTQCVVTDQFTCVQAYAGVWKGPGTDCTDADLDGIADDCEDRDYGDAPENALAYPSGIFGRFPTCRKSGPAGWIEHNNFGGWFGPAYDFEWEGNASQCPLFAPYDADECMNDGDAGLLFPGAYTLQGTTVAPCPQSTGGSLGTVCTSAVWGQNIDIAVHNTMPNHPPFVVGYVNVLIDWNQDGQWGGASFCGAASAPEHVLVDFQVPAGYVGRLSQILPAPPPFLIGPNPGYVWARFTITPGQLGSGWTGAGNFEDGETEDYLLFIDEPPPEFDWGDAPDPLYPTLSASVGASHIIVQGMSLGALIDAEGDGQPGPQAMGDDLANTDDEDGVVFNTALFSNVPNTIDVTVNPAAGGGLLNAWIDLDGNGSWADPGEQIFTDFWVVPGLNNLTFTPGTITAIGQTFARFRLSSQPGLSYTGAAWDGEVEDYRIDIAPVKWLQRPDVDWLGVDVDAREIELADDFQCTETGLITDFHIWTSFLSDQLPPEGLNGIPFTLTLYTDMPDPDPQDPSNWSHPGQPVWSRHFPPGSYNAGLCAWVPNGEWWHTPPIGFWTYPGDFNIYQYDFYVPPPEAYRQCEGHIYWLSIKYFSDAAANWSLGWKSSLHHWNDDAVWLDVSQTPPTWKELRYGGGHPMTPESMDLAFAVTGKRGPTTIVARNVFYNGSMYDGNNPGIDANDPNAIDTSKSAYMGGGVQSVFANVTSYAKGLNGLIYDIQDASIPPVPADFTFTEIGNRGDAPGVVIAPSGFVVTSLPCGITRVTITFADKVEPPTYYGTWLQVKIGTAFGLAVAETHWWGNVPGDTGNSATDLLVSGADVTGVRTNYTPPITPAPVSNVYDFNKDALVSGTDATFARTHYTNPVNAAMYITR